ncbi:hypothetical protein HYN59_05235 [Flavobacterium album]|uniref:Uncharacterized protein n=1 Tax=Flavobacterium album TaxID=2175091 RepID=A0A2S1QVW1_9FLAO|nr:hypothetical protein [Flavobacterium album]AWH84557.1 hypothetical protein HYN59_05235 [Flavobacterium album]
MKKWIMINYDLGLKGDYQNLYRFLDNHDALDCGNSNAALEIEVSEDNFDIIYEETKELIESEITISNNDRLYLTVTDSSCQMRGRFLFGTRKRAIWEGYGNKETFQEDVF